MFYIGCHVSIEGGYVAMAKRALSVGANTFQFFTKNPRGRSNGRLPSETELGEFLTLCAENGIHSPLAHGPYTYNPCAKDPVIREYTAQSMHGELEFLENIPGAMYNFHPGCHVGQGVEAGVAAVADMLSGIMWKGMNTTVLLETMAGKGTELGRSFEELRAIIDRVDPSVRDKVGVCLDTCHVHDGGYNIAEDPDEVLREFDCVVGIDRLRAIHINDSKNVRGAAKDRHEVLGSGNIPVESLGRIINHPQLGERPFYLETPNELEGYAAEIALLRGLRRD